jgi:uncharacterized protein (TIGR02118 family)
MIKLIVAVKRKSGMTPEDFRRHLSVNHAEVIKACPATARYLRKYVQSFPLPIAFRSEIQPFDAAAELYFDSVDDMTAYFSDPDYLATVRPDEKRFAEGSMFLVTEERRIV